MYLVAMDVWNLATYGTPYLYPGVSKFQTPTTSNILENIECKKLPNAPQAMVVPNVMEKFKNISVIQYWSWWSRSGSNGDSY